MKGDKETYSCFSCDQTIVTVQRDEGTLPMVFDCVFCSGLMKKDFSRAGVIGRKATHELYLRDDALSDKLSVKKLNDIEEEQI